jgi:HEPN domain-containing protein
MNKKTEYWLELCSDDLLTAKALLESKRYLHMGFFCHLIAEKALKAVIAEKTDDIPPKIHDLLKLSAKGEIFDKIPPEKKQLLNKLTPLQIEARYPEYKDKISATLSNEYCGQLLKETEEFLCWIKQQLEN